MKLSTLILWTMAPPQKLIMAPSATFRGNIECGNTLPEAE